MGYYGATEKSTKPLHYCWAKRSRETTFAREFLPKFAKCDQFINADIIASGLLPFSPEQVTFRAGRLLLEEIKRLAETNSEFAFETTLAGKTGSFQKDKRKTEGYNNGLITGFFSWLK